MYCTQYNIHNIELDHEAIFLCIVPSQEQNSESIRISLSELLSRFANTIRELTIVNPHSNIKLVDTSVISNMDKLTYLKIDSDSTVELDSIAEAKSLREVHLYTCSFDINYLPSSITILFMDKCLTNINDIAYTLPNLYRLNIKNTVIERLPTLANIKDLSILELDNCNMTVVDSSLYDLELEVLQIIHGRSDPLILNGTFISKSIDSIILSGNIDVDSMILQHRPSNILIRDNNVITKLPVLKKGTDMLDIRKCPNMKINTEDLHPTTNKVILDTHTYLNTTDKYTVAIQLLNK